MTICIHLKDCFSHDERLLKMVCQELWVCSKGKVWSIDGGLSEYRKMVEQEMVLS